VYHSTIGLRVIKRERPERGGCPPSGSYLRLIDSCTNQLEAQGPSRTCNESNKEEKKKVGGPERGGCPPSPRRPGPPRTPPPAPNCSESECECESVRDRARE